METVFYSAVLDAFEKVLYQTDETREEESKKKNTKTYSKEDI